MDVRAGKDGKTRFAIENASKTRIVLADQKIHILGVSNGQMLSKINLANHTCHRDSRI